MSEQPEAVAEAIAAELHLLRPEVRRSAAQLRSLMHPGFREIGASGALWERDPLIERLVASTGDEDPPYTASAMEGVQLAPDLVHLTFTVEAAGRCSHRSSLWRLTSDGWQMWFHQGTPTGAPDSRAL